MFRISADRGGRLYVLASFDLGAHVWDLAHSIWDTLMSQDLVATVAVLMLKFSVAVSPSWLPMSMYTGKSYLQAIFS